MKNNNLNIAKKVKNDEFYTFYKDIENEIINYKDFFSNKEIYCNCDNPKFSNFFHFFNDNFEALGLKKLTVTYFKRDKLNSYKLTKTVNGIEKEKMNGNGDFRSEECKEILNKSDIVVTNPPFSLFREYCDILFQSNKKFLVIGSMNAITYENVFENFKNNKIWNGINNINSFLTPNGEIQKFGNICWFTNLEHQKRKEFLILDKKYCENKKNYKQYDNFDAIEVDKIKNIPFDYNGLMGVPITFSNKYCPNQFEIVGLDKVLVKEQNGKSSRFKINNKMLYARIVIKRKEQ